MKKFTSFLSGAILGGLVGGLAVLLLTPSSGEDLRAELQQKIKNIQIEVQTAAKEKRVELEEELQKLRAPAAPEKAPDITIE